jgi:hypothetical protein
LHFLLDHPRRYVHALNHRSERKVRAS